MDYIKITLESDICIASGESSGNSVDSDICTDTYGIPFIPARRMKGCLREVADELRSYGYEKATEEAIKKLFGNSLGTEGAFHISDGLLKGTMHLREWIRDIERGKESRIIQSAVHPVNIKNIFTSVRGQTRMEDGVKVDNTLRFTRVMNQYNPLNLNRFENNVFYAPVEIVKEEGELEDLLEACCKGLRHIGLNRNRGLGNVKVEFCSTTEDATESENDVLVYRSKQSSKNIDSNFKKIDQLEAGGEDEIEIKYTIILDAPVSIYGCDGLETSIPARAMIGCMANAYLKKHRVDETFQNLFLNGKVRWSSITPVIDGAISKESPKMFVTLKNGGKKIINRFIQENEDWKKLKPKTLDGSYAAESEKGYYVGNPVIQTSFHNSLDKQQLYSQSSLETGMVYGGSVLINAADKGLAKNVIQLLYGARIQFGRSKSAQYAKCHLEEIKSIEVRKEKMLEPKCGDAVIVVLQSDLIINDGGIYKTENSYIRKCIAEELKRVTGTDCVTFGEIKETCENKENSEEIPVCPQGYMDVTGYKTVGGFQTMWNLQKAHVPAVQSGSVYCFESNGEHVPEQIILGECLQEGFGQCQIYLQSELKEKKEIEKHKIDFRCIKADGGNIASVKSALYVYVAMETIKKFARGIGKEYRGKDIPVSRLRLMLSEAKSYEDLVNRINDMKESDVSSVSRGKKVESRELIDVLYDEKEPLKKALESEEGLYEEIRKDADACQMIQKKWKLPLSILLHTMHYTK